MAMRTTMLRIYCASGRRSVTQSFLLPSNRALIKLGTVNGLRAFADGPKASPTSRDPSILSSDPAFLPGSQSSAAPAKVPPPPGAVKISSNSSPTPATPSSSNIIPPDSVPLVPPPPTKVQTAPPSGVPSLSPSKTPQAGSSTPTPPPPPTPKKKRRALRFLLYLMLTSGLAYGGAVFYALKSDNFHDFFTEYVPFGEESVLYFEERAFHKRFPNARNNPDRVSPAAQRDGNQITIPSNSGISWKVSDESDAGSSALPAKGRHMSALDDAKIAKAKEASAQSPPKQADGVKKPVEKDGAKKDTTVTKAAPKSASPAKKADQTPSPSPVKTPQTVPSVDQESRTPVVRPVTHLSPLEIPNAEDPLVQDLAKIVNDIITVVNADSADASNRYSAPLAKAKDSLANVGTRIAALKEVERQAAEVKIEEAHRKFDDSARELAKRIDVARHEEAAQFREEFETEREKLSRSYADKLKTEIDRARELSDKKLNNELTEQAIEMKRKFVGDIKSLVEKERDGRLSKITELSSSVDNLQKLTSDWNGVIDTNLSTQRLQVAVEAVRTAISRSAARDGRSKAFLNELAALKEVANGDTIVDAAIASINPTAYQRGIPSLAQLIDRFRRVSIQVRKASLLPENAGIASHAASFLLSKIMFKKEGQPSGEDVESVLTRAETLLEEGDLDSAAREMNALEGWAKVLSKDWMQECRRVLEVQQALDVIEAEARLQCLRVE